MMNSPERSRQFRPKRYWALVSFLICAVYAVLLLGGVDWPSIAGATFGLVFFLECLGDRVIWTDTHMTRRFFAISIATIDNIESSAIQREWAKPWARKTLRVWGKNGQTIGCQKWFWQDWDELVDLVATQSGPADSQEDSKARRS
jgi:hypothetical protein